MIPGGQTTKFIFVQNASGAAVTGLTTASFTYTHVSRPNGGAVSTYSAADTIAAVAGVNGLYAWTYTAPSAAGQNGHLIAPVSTANIAYNVTESGELENNDLDTIYASVARYQVALTSNGTIGQRVNLSIVNKRHVVLPYAFVDQTGAKIDMTVGVNYDDYTFGVRSATDDTLTPPKLDVLYSAPPTGWLIAGALGSLTVTIPEAATIFVLPEGAAPLASMNLNYDICAKIHGTLEWLTLVTDSTLTLTRRDGQT